MAGGSEIIRKHSAVWWGVLLGVVFAAPLHPGEHERHRQVPAQVLAPGYQNLPYEAPQPGSYDLPSLGAAADGVLLDSRGKRLHLKDLYGDKIVVLSFIYTSCSDVNGCPLATHVLGQVHKRIAQEPGLDKQVRFISISFDPRNDTPPVMQKYRDTFAGTAADWHFLTAESDTELEPLLNGFDQSLRRDYDAEGNFLGTFSHILRVFLIDHSGHIRNIYSVSYLHEQTLLNDIKTMLMLGGASETAGRNHFDVQDPGDTGRAYENSASGAVSKSLHGRRSRTADLLQFVHRPPLGLPPVPQPADNPLTPTAVELGRKLFYDRRLSHNNTISCAMCHVPEQGFTVNEMATAVGIEGRSVRRNAPTIYNTAYALQIFHDGRENRLEQQVWGPLLAVNEMGNPSIGYVIECLRAFPDYTGMFEHAFNGRGPGMETIGMALAAYERTLVSANSPFDRWHFGGQADALTPAAERGYNLFSGKAGCSRCHVIGTDHALFTDNALHNTGIGYRAAFAGPGAGSTPAAGGNSPTATVAVPDSRNDLGRYEVTEDPADRWKYKTPSLRNVALTAPYMHNGSIGSLRGVVEFYNRGGIPNENLDPLIRPLQLTPGDIDDLVAFLYSLTGDNTDIIIADALAAPIGDP